MKAAAILRTKQVAGWGIFCVFLVGFFYSPVGAWTGSIMGAWFVGTQRIRRGFVWLFAITVTFSVPRAAIAMVHAGPRGAIPLAAWTLAAAALGVLPFTLHRATSPRLPGFASTLPLPFFAVIIAAVGRRLIAHATTSPFAAILHRVDLAIGAGASLFLVYWFAALLVWMWDLEFRPARVTVAAVVFSAISTAALVLAAIGHPVAIAGTGPLAFGMFDWVCVAGAIALSAWSLLSLRQETPLPQSLRILRSPETGEPLQAVHQNRNVILTSPSGERFPMRDGIPDLRRPGDLTGLNRKYNDLYQGIGGFYDDGQRVVCALSGFDRDEYVMSYLGMLEVKDGDSVLETSVGTGLNLKYLPRAVRRCGIDLSGEMLARCRGNLRRWGLDADLFLANAESLPFADESFDVVFHVGGINFFNDRAKAIREMIRVARPGTRIVIADETEEHVQAAFEKAPVTGRYFRNRKQAVAPPLDLVPAEMLEKELRILNVVGKNRFYVLTFRKPPAEPAQAANAELVQQECAR